MTFVDTLLASAADYTGPGILALVAMLVLTRRLVWHTDLQKVEKDRDEWKDMALRSVGVAERTTISAEVTAQALSSLPDPGATP